MRKQRMKKEGRKHSKVRQKLMNKQERQKSYCDYVLCGTVPSVEMLH